MLNNVYFADQRFVLPGAFFRFCNGVSLRPRPTSCLLLWDVDKLRSFRERNRYPSLSLPRATSRRNPTLAQSPFSSPSPAAAASGGAAFPRSCRRRVRGLLVLQRCTQVGDDSGGCASSRVASERRRGFLVAGGVVACGGARLSQIWAPLGPIWVWVGPFRAHLCCS
jgi:hypothetical protein